MILFRFYAELLKITSHLSSRISCPLCSKACTSVDLPNASRRHSRGLNNSQCCWIEQNVRERYQFIKFTQCFYCRYKCVYCVHLTLWFMPSVILIPITNTSSNLPNKQRFCHNFTVTTWFDSNKVRTECAHGLNGQVMINSHQHRLFERTSTCRVNTLFLTLC